MIENILFNINNDRQYIYNNDIINYYIAFSNSYLNFQNKKIKTHSNVVIENKILPTIKTIKQQRKTLIFTR